MHTKEMDEQPSVKVEEIPQPYSVKIRERNSASDEGQAATRPRHRQVILVTIQQTERHSQDQWVNVAALYKCHRLGNEVAKACQCCQPFKQRTEIWNRDCSRHSC
ncbi:protein of unknown function [Methylorubrum extorquens DM4]|uniref:Uncharacterized protein n=1 Tax=Methylorubrum extorquens (strain DSM 6343 / CIP 106787 / DM4) TaxID=661410 RepID=C7CIS9_METED|nr:protein of unknown function [Methylorubrum extorquens DM4]